MRVLSIHTSQVLVLAKGNVLGGFGIAEALGQAKVDNVDLRKQKAEQ